MFFLNLCNSEFSQLNFLWFQSQYPLTKLLNCESSSWCGGGYFVKNPLSDDKSSRRIQVSLRYSGFPKIAMEKFTIFKKKLIHKSKFTHAGLSYVHQSIVILVVNRFSNPMTQILPTHHFPPHRRLAAGGAGPHRSIDLALLPRLSGGPSLVHHPCIFFSEISYTWNFSSRIFNPRSWSQTSMFSLSG